MSRLLAPGTVVADRLVPPGHARRGVVQPYEPEWSQGTFPVRFEDGIWRLRTGDEVTVVQSSDLERPHIVNGPRIVTVGESR